MRKALQKIMNMPYSKLIPQVSDDFVYYDKMIHTYSGVLRLARRERNTRQLHELRETMRRYLDLAKSQKEALVTWGNGLLSWAGM